MSDAQARLNVLEQAFATEKAKFAQWKIEHIKGAGTDSYNEYVSNFERWEHDIILKRAELINQIRAAAPLVPLAPTNDVDSQLEQIMNTITPTDFVIAMFTAANKDPKIAEAVFNAPQGPSQPPAVHHPYATAGAPVYSQGSHYQVPYGTPSVSSYATPSVSYQPTPSVNAYPSHYVPTTVPAVSTPSVAQEAWASAALKSYRPLSPVRDYRKIPQLPFSDFSQT